MDFDRVEARLDGEASGVGVGGDHIVDIIAGGAFGESHRDGIEEPHRCQRPGLVGSGVRDGAGVADLRADRRALRVDRVGQSMQSGHGLRAHPDLPALGAPAGCHRAVGDRRHADPTRGEQPVVADQVVGDQRVRGGGLERRSLDDPVAQGHRAELGRGEHIGLGVRTGSLPQWLPWVRSRWTARPRATRSSPTSPNGSRR